MIQPKADKESWLASVSRSLFSRPIPPDEHGLLLTDVLSENLLGIAAVGTEEEVYRDYERRVAQEK